MNLYIALFMLCVACLLGALVLALGAERNPRSIQAPGSHSQPRSLSLHVDLPPIATMAHYYGGDDDSWAPYNPFIPPADRARDVALAQSPPPTSRPPTPETVPPPPTGPRDPPPPPPELPPIDPLDLSGRSLPRVIGGLGRGTQQELLVLHAGHYHLISVNDSVGVWVLRRIGANSAYFSYGDDLELTRVAIGMAEGDTAMRGSSDSETGGGATGGDEGSSRIGGFDLNDPMVQEYLNNNPRIREMVRNNPERARQILEMMMGERQR